MRRVTAFVFQGQARARQRARAALNALRGWATDEYSRKALDELRARAAQEWGPGAYDLNHDALFALIEAWRASE